jgi:cardiolipin synthase
MLWEITTGIVLIVYVYTILTTIVLLLMENRNPVKSIAWIVVLITVPIVGFVFYIFFGRNIRRRIVLSRRSLHKVKRNSTMIASDIEQISSSVLSPEQRNIATLARNSCDALAYESNKLEIYTDGVSVFEDIFEDIKKAKHHIHLEYYIFLDDEIGRKMIDVLIGKVKEGVAVRVIIDDVGSWQMPKSTIREMQSQGIEVMSFLKVGLPFLSSKVNYRNHRKILIVDGKVGFTGGINIADRYVKGLKWGKWRDTHIRIEGPAVHGLQKIFLTDWYFVNRELISDAVFYPDLEKSGNSLVQIITSGPNTLWNSVMQVYFMAIVQAREYVYIQTPYFLPTESIITALQTAVLSGVDVRIILPMRSDAKVTLASSYSYMGEMLKAGVKMYFYQPGFLHSKTIVIDDKLFTVGSTNMDFRSFEQNFEVNALVFDPEIAVKMRKIFEQDLACSTRVNAKTWRKRPVKVRLKESIARLFSPLL